MKEVYYKEFKNYTIVAIYSKKPPSREYNGNVYKWCCNHESKGRFWFSAHRKYKGKYSYYFELEEDAILFKLKFS